MRTQPRCKRCGEKIGFAPIPGFRLPGQPKYYAVNADDRKPHGPRCALVRALKKAKESGSKPLSKKQKGRLTAQRAEAPKPTEGVQIDAFERV